MAERTTTTTTWECDGCDLVADFQGRMADLEDGTVAALGPEYLDRNAVPKGWTRLVLQPLNDPGDALCDRKWTRRLYCPDCLGRASDWLDLLLSYWKADRPERLLHILGDDPGTAPQTTATGLCGYTGTSLGFLGPGAFETETLASSRLTCDTCEEMRACEPGG